jgi:hypothetical protein
VNFKPAVASILLPKNPEFYRELFKFLLFREGYEVAVTTVGNSAIGMSEDDLAAMDPAEDLELSVHRNPRTQNQPSVGIRNVHAMSGRTE